MNDIDDIDESQELVRAKFTATMQLANDMMDRLVGINGYLEILNSLITNNKIIIQTDNNVIN